MTKWERIVVTGKHIQIEKIARRFHVTFRGNITKYTRVDVDLYSKLHLLTLQKSFRSSEIALLEMLLI